MQKDFKYCNNLTSYSRFKTSVINIGDVPLGGHHPIRIQSMTNTNTLDTAATVNQVMRLAEAGCDYVRMAAQGMKEADNLARIKKDLAKNNCFIPLIADVHFNPLVAEAAARVVEKVRINPGNYVDRKNIRKWDYTDAEYHEEHDKIRDRITPLLKICNEYGTAIRIGVNHGSLSDRILSRFGDTPAGMVESAMEFISICEDLYFKNYILSLKASNIKVMIEANRLLAHRMMKLGMTYPIHLGVTEAGSGIEGRIRSAAGIGPLLEDGIGDTIRVSLTEDPVAEIPICRLLINRYEGKNPDFTLPGIENSPVNPFEFYERHSNEVEDIGGNNEKIVIITNAEPQNAKCDLVFHPNESLLIAKSFEEKKYILLHADQYCTSASLSQELKFVRCNISSLSDAMIEKLKEDSNTVLVFTPEYYRPALEVRRMFFKLMEHHCKTPVIFNPVYHDVTEEEFALYAASDASLLFTDGLSDGLWAESNNVPSDKTEQIVFDILQATGARITKTEYVSCPTCGRTSFNIFETVERVKQFTSHLKGLKIAIMGCVVNGPGEMADADYGYVGSAPGKVNLYKGRELVRRNIPEQEALTILIEIIKEQGDWTEET